MASCPSAAASGSSPPPSEPVPGARRAEGRRRSRALLPAPVPHSEVTSCQMACTLSLAMTGATYSSRIVASRESRPERSAKTFTAASSGTATNAPATPQRNHPTRTTRRTASAFRRRPPP